MLSLSLSRSPMNRSIIFAKKLVDHVWEGSKSQKKQLGYCNHTYKQCDQIWLNFVTWVKSLWQFFDSLCSIWQNCEHTLENLVWYWANDYCFLNSQMLNKKYSHLGTLPARYVAILPAKYNSEASISKAKDLKRLDSYINKYA